MPTDFKFSFGAGMEGMLKVFLQEKQKLEGEEMIPQCGTQAFLGNFKQGPVIPGS